ncbi:MAG: T9SS type A sorting domain-containing protein [Lentimicrobiaceae bacterium]|nr:T9SS type A sorting domain-containing protein [Lentimicrobiaceae bacterium]
MLDDYGAGATLKVQSSSDGTNWTDEAWSLATSSNSNVGPYLVNTTIQNNLNSASTYIAFTIEGNLYQYDYWYIDNVSVSAAAVTSYQITTSSNPTAGGSTSGGGNYNQGAQATVTASPANGYNFINWTENGNPVSTSASYTFTVNANRTLVANFTIQQFTVSTSSSPMAGGTTSGGGSYNFGAQATVTASPANGYNFINWTENGNTVSTSASYTFTVNANRTLVANFTIQQFTVSTSSSPTAGGTTSGGGSYNFGAQATVTASPANGYNFVNWTENGNPVSTSASYTFTVNANRTLVANFTIQQFTVSTSSSPTAGGTTSGGGSYNFGAQATVTASPANGYNFVNWTENGNPVSTSASYTFTVNANRTLVANFTIQQFTVSTSSSPTAGGTTSGGGSYNFGAQATVTASPANGYNFVNWTENGNPVSTSASYTFTVNANRTLVANFTEETIEYTITTLSSPASGGNTTGGGTYVAGAQATVTASPANGYNFVNWTENGNPVSTSASYTFTVNTNRTLVANFTEETIEYTITTLSSPASGGNTTGGGTYVAGAQATVTASPANGYNFVNWTENGNPVSTSASYTFTVNANRTLVANFTEETIITITTLSSPASGGNTTGGGTYVAGAQATVTASPANGYNFVNWTENGNPVSTSASYTFTVNANRTLVANFTEETIEYTITTLSSPASGGNTAGGGTYVAGAQATVTASPANGYNFVNWTENGNPVSTSASYTFTVNANRTLVANFTEETIEYTITTLSSPASGGNTAGGGTYVAGAQATVTASPANGYNFVNWTENGNPVSTSASYTFTVNANRTLVANFTIQQYFIKLNANPENGGYTNGEGYYNEGETATIEAFENNGYMFVSWEENGNPVSTNPVYSFQVNSSRELVAHFELQVGIITHDQIGIVIYPNPSTGIVYLESASPESVIFEAVEVVNLAGKKVYDAQITNPISKVKARLNSLPDGVYFFKIKPLNHNEFIRKIIIKK